MSTEIKNNVLAAADSETAEIRRALDSGEITIEEANKRQARVGEAVTQFMSPEYARFADEVEVSRAIPVQQVGTPQAAVEVRVENH